jgi:hypothetical protein
MQVTQASEFSARYGFSFLQHASMEPDVANGKKIANNVFSLQSSVSKRRVSLHQSFVSILHNLLSFIYLLALSPPLLTAFFSNGLLRSVSLRLSMQVLVIGGSSCKGGCTRYDESRRACRVLSGRVPAGCCLVNETCLHRFNTKDVWASHDLV